MKNQPLETLWDKLLENLPQTITAEDLLRFATGIYGYNRETLENVDYYFAGGAILSDEEEEE